MGGGKRAVFPSPRRQNQTSSSEIHKGRRRLRGAAAETEGREGGALLLEQDAVLFFGLAAVQRDLDEFAAHEGEDAVAEEDGAGVAVPVDA